jgi:hypothetical protein
MRVLYIEYALWKQITQTRGFTAFHEVVTTDTLRVWSGMPEVVYAADVEPANFADWQAAFPSSTLVLGEDTALANIAGLGATLQPRSADGTPQTAGQNLTLGQLAFTRADDGTEPMNVNGEASGTPVNLWNGTGGGDTGADWPASGTGSEQAAADAGAGTNGWDTGVAAQNDATDFDNGSLVDVDALYGDLQFQINPQAWPATSRLRVGFLDASNNLVGNWRRAENYTTNMDLGIWQPVSIPIVDFALTGQVQKLHFEYRSTSGQHHYFDDIKLVPSGGNGPYRFRVAAPNALTRYHVSMIVFMVSGPTAGWTSTSFANISALSKGVILRQRRISDGAVLWSFNSKDNVELFGRYHPQDDIEFADGTLLVGFMVKPGKASIVVSDDAVLEFVVRDDLSALAAARAFAHYGVEVLEP